MTREDAINALDIVKHIESIFVFYEPGEPMNHTTVGELKEACKMAISILSAQTDTPPNAPLTLEELREMDGEPVYCISDYEMTVNGEKGHQFHAEGWGIVTGTDLGDQGFIVGTAYIYYLKHYGKTWLAYRRKPEEAA